MIQKLSVFFAALMALMVVFLAQGATAQEAVYSYAPRLTSYTGAAFSGWGGPVLDTAQDSGAADMTAQAQGNEPAATPPTSPVADAGLWGAMWSGRANAGARLQSGNTEGNTLSLDTSTKAKWGGESAPAHRASLKAEYHREESDGRITEDNRKLSGMYDYFFRENWFMNTSLSLEQDDIDKIDLRSNFGLGIGHQAFEDETLNLQYVFGPSYLRTKFEDGDSEDSLAARWALEYDQMFADGLFQTFHEHEILMPTDNTDAFLFDSKTGLRLPIRAGIVGTAEVDFEWDNAPEVGVKEDDTTYAIKIGYEW